MTKADSAISSIPRIIVTSDDFCNDGMPSDLLFPSGTYIDVELDVRVETTTPNKGNKSIEGKVSDVIPSCHCEAIVKVHGVLPSSRWYSASSRRILGYLLVIVTWFWRPKQEWDVVFLEYITFLAEEQK
ncbi:hypothetical protein KY290_008928 [Solanum tuberosum]|uniref:Uncharacterized protein n=1 Tax=Solanum tuberosum TaxID=4113 RepID=A0ABQ7W9T4_SOLTU|nr:hypothetical protein KY285_008875 [Solanum tuberosum]KAH0777517.1 hypothetical protein KY290_008928 [Solanum tuberosum]